MPNDKPINGLASDVQKALKDAVNNQLHQAVITSKSNGEIKIDATLTGTARDAAKSAVVNHAARKLCEGGYVVSVTCDSKAPGKATYYLDFETEKGRERIVVGVAMDNDRASYLLKKVTSGMQSIFSGK